MGITTLSIVTALSNLSDTTICEDVKFPGEAAKDGTKAVVACLYQGRSSIRAYDHQFKPGKDGLANRNRTSYRGDGII